MAVWMSGAALPALILISCVGSVAGYTLVQLSHSQLAETASAETLHIALAARRRLLLGAVLLAVSGLLWLCAPYLRRLNSPAPRFIMLGLLLAGGVLLIDAVRLGVRYARRAGQEAIDAEAPASSELRPATIRAQRPPSCQIPALSPAAPRRLAIGERVGRRRGRGGSGTGKAGHRPSRFKL